MWRLPKWVVRLAASKETKVQKDLCLKFRHGNWEHAGTYLWLFRRCVSQTPLKWLKTPSQGCCDQKVWQQVLEVCSTCTQRTPGRKHGIVTLPIWHFSWWFPGLSCTHLMDKNWHQLDIIEKKSSSFLQCFINIPNWCRFFSIKRMIRMIINQALRRLFESRQVSLILGPKPQVGAHGEDSAW